ncbi:hypothetical protein NEDG_00421 [Nematocida displodere]|uniref:Major facilitator superfamily associated domain-containing protein n=1 Tax=Nematocida displodere TaxID=1805483 RepID=A0A177EJS6_9MICR|nr:hypothetical protein NEDG_00421 [Nematocida displodere]
MNTKQKNVAHIGIFGLGTLLSVLGAYSMFPAPPNGLGIFRHLFAPTNYALAMLIVLLAVYITRKNAKIELYHRGGGCIMALAMVYMVGGSLCGIDMLLRFCKAAQHISIAYCVVGLILSLRFLPVFSTVADELGPNTHVGLKIAYYMLNISIYATHTFSTHFFNAAFNLSLAHYGWITCLSSFYLVNIFIGPVADKYLITKKLTITMSAISTGVYSTFLILRNMRKDNMILMVGIFSLYIITMSPVFSMFDVLVLNDLSKKYSEKAVEERKQIFSRIRMWASFGHATSGMSIAYIHRIITDGSGASHTESANTQFTVLVCVIVAASAIFISIVSLCSSEVTESRVDAAKESAGGVGEARDVVEAKSESKKDLLRNPNFYALLFSITAIGVTRGISSCFLVSYMSLYFKVAFSKVTSILCVRTLTEMLVFYHSKHLLKFFGYHWLLFFALGAATLREFNYAHMPDTKYIMYFAMANETLKGISSACLTFSAVNIADSLGGKKNKAFAQTCYSACYNGVSLLISSLLSIATLELLQDFRSLFLMSSLVGFTSGCVLIIKYGLIDRSMGFSRQVKAMA